MKMRSFLIGLIAGGAIVFILTKQFNSANTLQDQNAKPAKWKWSDSLEAVKAAPNSHRILFENDNVRILEVTLDPYAFEPMHTHHYPSVMFGSDKDTSQFDIIYYPYGYDSTKHIYFAKDSIKQHRGGEANEPNTGNYMEPEGPHRVKNLSNVKIEVFRVELKMNGRN
jgi:hypothetical protein